MTTTGTGSTTRQVQYARDDGSGKSAWRTETIPGTSSSSPEAGWSQVKGYYIPQTTATTTLSPAQQAIKDQNDAASLNLGTIANQQSNFLKDYLSKPVSLDNDAVEGRLYELGRKRLDPMLADRTASLQTQLSNQGIKLGSSAYQKALDADTQGGNDAYNSLLLSGRQQSISEILAQRNQPLNEISALMSGSQVSQPQWAQTAQSNIPTVDYAGLVQQNYQSQMQQYQAAQANKQATLGGLFGLGSSLIKLSDRRLKTDIHRIGQTDDGLGIYSYRYTFGSELQIGLMADEVEALKPEAVITLPSGFKAVDYGRALSLEAR